MIQGVHRGVWKMGSDSHNAFWFPRNERSLLPHIPSLKYEKTNVSSRVRESASIAIIQDETVLGSRSLYTFVYSRLAFSHNFSSIMRGKEIPLKQERNIRRERERIKIESEYKPKPRFVSCSRFPKILGSVTRPIRARVLDFSACPLGNRNVSSSQLL